MNEEVVLLFVYFNEEVVLLFVYFNEEVGIGRKEGMRQIGFG